MDHISVGQRALSIADVLLSIVDHIGPEDDIDLLSSEQKTLFHLGQTCKAAWHEIKPRLWRALRAEAIYVNLPDDVKRLASGDISFSARIIQEAVRQRLLSNEEAEPLKRYCCYTRLLYLQELNTYSRNTARNFLFALAVLPQLHAKIPALHHISRIVIFNVHSASAASLTTALSPFLGQELQSISLGLGRLQETPTALFRAIGERCSSLLHIHVDCTYMQDWGAISRSLCETVWKYCVGLKTVQVHFIDHGPEVWKALSALPDLEEVDCTARRNVSAIQPVVPDGLLVFPKLRVLTARRYQEEEEFEIEGTIDTSAFVPVTFSPLLAKLEFTCASGQKVFEMAAIVVDRWSETLRELDISTVWQDDETGSLSFTALILQLYLLPHLTGLGIHDTYPFTLQDSDIDRLTEAWPNLTRLQFSTRVSSWKLWTSRLTRRSIYTLAKAYPGLHSLAISIDHCRPYVEPLSLPQAAPTCPLLIQWDSVDSRLNNVRGTVAFMLRYFPNIRIFYGSSSTNERAFISESLGTSSPDRYELQPAYVSPYEWSDFHFPDRGNLWDDEWDGTSQSSNSSLDEDSEYPADDFIGDE
ncbi:hypothetical protein CALVIDRAFT_580792 [Calocera viscosa TUFC12733]|uniref:Uncharacterized protein n=1 Tax=Calocera viscosa (strain TUFC12733) TaxID=1330018 RepID=A0A167RHW8_CALVF|nr:hypothetical protein CALVIDRAFT_580792 [Calocera viscosa TUFC12733]